MNLAIAGLAQAADSNLGGLAGQVDGAGTPGEYRADLGN